MIGLQQQSKLFKEKFNKGIAKTYLEKIKYSYKKSRLPRKIKHTIKTRLLRKIQQKYNKIKVAKN